MIKARLLVTVASLASLFGAAQANAGAFLLREQGAAATGLSTAGAAAGGAGLGSMFWNPATMTDFAGMQSSSNLTGILPSAHSDVSAGTFLAFGAHSGQVGQDAVLPASYYSLQLTDRLWVGAAINTPFGLTTRNPLSWAGSPFGVTARISSIDLTPSIAYKVNDWMSVSAGVIVQHFKAYLTQGVPALPGPVFFPPGALTATVKGDGWGVGFIGGVTLKPMDGTEIGIGYRSAITQTLTGRFTIPGVFGTPAQLKISTPDMITIGLRQRITPVFDMLAGFEYDHWRIGTLPILTSSGQPIPTAGGFAAVPFNYKNGWLASLGGEYKWNSAIKLRAGVAYEKSPIDNSNRSTVLPDSNRIWLSAGLSYNYNSRLSFDLSYAHLFGRDGSVFQTTPVLLVASTKAHVDLVAVGATYRFDTPAASVLTAKY